jgi:hypothetical protein
MKQSQFKSLIKEIVRMYMSETNPQAIPEYVGWHKIGDTAGEFTAVRLPDNRVVNITVEFDGKWDDGAFDHAFGTHRYPLRFDVDNVEVTSAVDSQTRQNIPLDAAIVAAGESLFDSQKNAIMNSMSPPENDGPDPDDARDRKRDR